MLNSKVNERINRALNFQEADRVPVCDYLDNKKAFRFYSPNSKITLAEKVTVYHKLGIDVCWRHERPREGYFEKMKGFLNRLAYPENQFAALTQEEVRGEFEEFKHQQKFFEPDTYLAMSCEGCLSFIYRRLGFENFCEKMYVDSMDLEKMMDICADNLYVRANEFARQNLGGIFFIMDDIAYNKGLIFSPRFLEQHWLPKIRNAISPLKRKNIKVILHSDGNLTDIIDKLIDIGIDGIHPVDEIAGMDIGVLKKKYAKTLLLFGNVDLYQLDPNDVAKQTRRCIEKASFGGGHFIGSSTGVIDDRVQLDNIFAFLSTINDYGKPHP
ncbi:MAG: hypothetical protein KKB82_00130 [Candidatus Omnitrophica bacterium]|nr:hypothetical protein [Candidatus Omnitrophota bacterium]MBU1924309.1 hypothetical protein [Candidatus Omnitrophota bacterium]